MNTLVTGSTGLVGSHFVRYFNLKSSEQRLLTPSEKELDITLPQAVRTSFNKFQPQIVVHFAAFTDVSVAEQERGNKQGFAWITNVEGTKNIVDACIANKSYLIHISTDVVFSGRKENPGPYEETVAIETDPDNLSWYGWTKAQAELIVSKDLPSAAIIRIANPVRSRFKNKLDYVRKIIYLYDKKKLYPMFTDQYLTLTFINEVSEVVTRLINSPKSGVYHVSSRDVFTPFELASYLLEKVRGVKNVVHKSSIEDYFRQTKNSARYPQYGGLKTEKTQKRFKIEFLSWQEVVDALINEGVTATLFSSKE
jgi:dTDP-4-dehydrorhamnose reductase